RYSPAVPCHGPGGAASPKEEYITPRSRTSSEASPSVARRTSITCPTLERAPPPRRPSYAAPSAVAMASVSWYSRQCTIFPSFRHFPTKDDLLRAILKDLLRLTDEVAALHADGDPATAL